MNTRDSFGGISPQSFATRGLINSFCLCRLECTIKPASSYQVYQQLGNWADKILFPKIFCGINLQLKTPNRSAGVSLHEHAFKMLLNSPTK